MRREGEGRHGNGEKNQAGSMCPPECCEIFVPCARQRRNAHTAPPRLSDVIGEAGGWWGWGWGGMGVVVGGRGWGGVVGGGGVAWCGGGGAGSPPPPPAPALPMPCHCSCHVTAALPQHAVSSVWLLITFPGTHMFQPDPVPPPKSLSQLNNGIHCRQKRKTKALGARASMQKVCRE